MMAPLDFLQRVAQLSILGHIPAWIAARKGRIYQTWYWYGVLLFPIALVHSLLMKADYGRCPDCMGEVAILDGRKGQCVACGKRLARRNYQVAEIDGKPRLVLAASSPPEAGALPKWVWGIIGVIACWGLLMLYFWLSENDRALAVEYRNFAAALLIFAILSLLVLGGCRWLALRRARNDARELEEAIAWENSGREAKF